MYLIQSAGDARSQRPSVPTQNMRVSHNSSPNGIRRDSKFDANRMHSSSIRFRTLSARHTPTSPEKGVRGIASMSQLRQERTRFMYCEDDVRCRWMMMIAEEEYIGTLFMFEA